MCTLVYTERDGSNKPTKAQIRAHTHSSLLSSSLTHTASQTGVHTYASNEERWLTHMRGLIREYVNVNETLV